MERKDYNDIFLDTKRSVGDLQADLFIREVFTDPEKKKALQHWLSSASANADLESFRRIFPEAAFITPECTLPVWANQRLMKDGAKLFARHTETIMTLLGLLSLPYCYCAANGAMVLYLSERMRNETAKRLYDTALFVWEVMAPDAFEKQGNGFTAAIKVRLIHATVRYYTAKSGKWDNAWGTPVNQEDMAGTNLSFSFVVIRGLRKLGISVSQEEQIAFLHLWNVIGFLTGLEDDLIPENPRSAQMLDQVISRRQFVASAHGRALARSLSDHILSVNKSKATANDIMGLMRHLLGSNAADMLSVDASELPAWKLSLIRTMNLLKSFKPNGDSVQNYRTAYATFKKAKSQIQ